MNCTSTRRRLRGLERGASADVVPGAAEHLAECPACRAWWAGRARLDQVLAGLSQPVVPLELRARVLDAVARRRPRPVYLTGRSAAVAVAVLVAVLVPVGRPRGPRVVAVAETEFRSDSLLQQHAFAVSADPLADAASMHALATVAMRAEWPGGVGQ